MGRRDSSWPGISGRFGRRRRALLAASVAFLSGCVSAYVRDAQNAEMAELDKIVVAAAEAAPGLAGTEGAPEPIRTARIADLTFRAHAIPEDAIRQVHAAAGGRADVSAGNVVTILLVEGLLYPLIPLDLLTAAVLTMTHEAGKLSDRAMGIVHDQAGAYRWHFCCPSIDTVQGPGFPRAVLPAPYENFLEHARLDSADRRRTALRYGEDYWTMVCDGARLGDAEDRVRLSIRHDRNGTLADKIQRHYWLKQMERDDPDDKQIKLDIYSIELDLSPEHLSEARRLVEQRAPRDIDCREIAPLLNGSAQLDAAGS